jgi:tetrahydromethanopterin S-methyltransferase subunit E
MKQTFETKDGKEVTINNKNVNKNGIYIKKSKHNIYFFYCFIGFLIAFFSGVVIFLTNITGIVMPMKTMTGQGFRDLAHTIGFDIV